MLIIFVNVLRGWILSNVAQSSPFWFSFSHPRRLKDYSFRGMFPWLEKCNAHNNLYLTRALEWICMFCRSSLCHSPACVTVQHASQSSLRHSSACVTVQPVSQSSLCRSPACVTVQPVWLCHSPACVTLQPVSQSSLCHSPAYVTVQPLSQSTQSSLC